MKESLIICGTGIKTPSHMTLETQGAIADADKIFCLCNSELATMFIKALNSNTIDLISAYENDGFRTTIYAKIVAEVLNSLDKNQTICLVVDGHPTVLVNASIDLANQARQKGFVVRILPGVSAEACLFSDLEINPGRYGILSMDATEFLLRPRHFDTTVGLILWQIGITGNFKTYSQSENKEGLKLLLGTLVRHYGPDHEVIIYEAATLPAGNNRIEKFPLVRLDGIKLNSFSTLFVPPQGDAALDYSILQNL